MTNIYLMWRVIFGISEVKYQILQCIGSLEYSYKGSTNVETLYLTYTSWKKGLRMSKSCFEKLIKELNTIPQYI